MSPIPLNHADPYDRYLAWAYIELGGDRMDNDAINTHSVNPTDLSPDDYWPVLFQLIAERHFINDLRRDIEEALVGVQIPVNIQELVGRLTVAASAHFDNVEDHIDVRVSEDLAITLTPKTEFGRLMVKIAAGEI